MYVIIFYYSFSYLPKMTEISSVQKKDFKIEQKPLTSTKKSTKHKKLKGKKKLVDISNQVTLEFKYEDFEQETDSFFPQIYREENTISINKVHLLDQSHLRFLINPNSSIVEHYTSYKQKNFKNISWQDIELIYFYCNEMLCTIWAPEEICSSISPLFFCPQPLGDRDSLRVILRAAEQIDKVSVHIIVDLHLCVSVR